MSDAAPVVTYDPATKRMTAVIPVAAAVAASLVESGEFETIPDPDHPQRSLLQFRPAVATIAIVLALSRPRAEDVL